MIREELLHPAFVHFPIVIFTLALIFKFIATCLFKNKSSIKFSFQLMTQVFIFVGPFTYVLSMYLGDISFDLLRESICNYPAVVNHEEAAQIPLYFFILAMLFEVLNTYKSSWSHTRKNIVSFIIIINLLIGNIYMFKSASLGGELVYKYGTGVENHKCQEH